MPDFDHILSEAIRLSSLKKQLRERRGGRGIYEGLSPEEYESILRGRISIASQVRWVSSGVPIGYDCDRTANTHRVWVVTGEPREEAAKHGVSIHFNADDDTWKIINLEPMAGQRREHGGFAELTNASNFAVQLLLKKLDASGT